MAIKTVRVIAYNAALKNLKTVNVISTVPAPAHAKPHLQAGATLGTTVPTVMAAPSVIPGLKTIQIAGYTGPI